MRRKQRDRRGIWECTQDYEKIQLRQVFLEEVERVKPAWIKKYRRSTVKADFESVGDIADSGWYKKAINGWLDPVIYLDWIQNRLVLDPMQSYTSLGRYLTKPGRS